MFKTFIKNNYKSFQKTDIMKLTVLLKADFFRKDFIFIVLHNSFENYWELVVLKYPFALFNESFFNQFFPNERLYGLYKDRKFSLISITASLQVKQSVNCDLNSILQENVKDLFSDFFSINYNCKNISPYLKEPIK